MSNRRSRRPSRSLSARPTAAEPSGHRRIGWWVAAAVAVVLAVAALTAVLVGRSPSSPALDGQAARGQQLATQRGCLSCHSTTGNRSEGPTWKGLAGQPVTLASGQTVTADDAYLARSIREPAADIVQGYRAGMPTGSLNDDEVAAIVAYIKALG